MDKIYNYKEQQPVTEHIEQHKQLTHIDERGDIHMVDVTDRAETTREATAKARVRMLPQTARLIENNQVAKGNVLEIAKIAAILAAKQTPQLIPLCHPLPLTSIDVQLTLDSTQGLIYIQARVRTHYKTGVEVEAFTAATVAALTIYDMCKGVDSTITLEQAYIARKSGGKSGVVEFQPEQG
ncbi:MAG TPA: cyclic pyranopterin monophosphate synthase MoaC [Ktedonobacter sp.]|nr:cyclic pyranopterin monophosphate synthase MoaC [Ktedonobacter sp.]